MAQATPLVMPAIGLGCGPLKKDEGVGLMTEAIRMGYRLLDTAQHYGNEREVGEAVRASGVARSDIIVLTKIWPDKLGADDVKRAVDESLARIDAGPIDLLVAHWPNPNIPVAETMGAFNAARDAGLVRQIGVSNFTTRQIAEAQAVSAAPLVANEIEYHPYLKQDAVLADARGRSMTVIAHCPLHRVGELFSADPVSAAAERHGRAPAQIVLRWHVQQGVVPIPSSHRLERLKQNISIFDFELSAAEMDSISGLAAARQHRICAQPIPYEWDR